MERFFVPRAPPGKAEIIFIMVDGTLYGGTYFVSFIPFLCSTDNTGISAKILFRIKIYHPSTAGRGTGMFTKALSMTLLRGYITDPFDLGADKFKTNESVIPLGSSFMFHGKRGILWTAGDPILTDGIIGIFETTAGIEGIKALEKCRFSPKVSPESNS